MHQNDGIQNIGIILWGDNADEIRWVTVGQRYSEATEVEFTANKVNDDGAVDGVVVAVIGIPDAGVILSTSGGMEVEFPSSKVDDDGTLGGVVVAVIGKLDAGVILRKSGGMKVELTAS